MCILQTCVYNIVPGSDYDRWLVFGTLLGMTPKQGPTVTFADVVRLG